MVDSLEKMIQKSDQSDWRIKLLSTGPQKVTFVFRILIFSIACYRDGLLGDWEPVVDFHDPVSYAKLIEHIIKNAA